jgi:hypothetical protein
MRLARSAWFGAIIFFLGTSPALLAQQLSSQATPAQVASTPQFVYSALWRVDGNFQATLRMRNVSLLDPITVSPVLYMSDGLSYEIAPITIPAASISSININDALASAPTARSVHFSQYGNVAVRFIADSPSRVSASVELLDSVSSISFVSQCSAQGSVSASKQVIEGLWWKRDRHDDGFVALTNTTSKSMAVNYNLVTSNGVSKHVHYLVLGVHQTTLVDLGDLLAELPDEESTTGGLRITFQGRPGELLVLGGLQNVFQGYSVKMPFISALQDGSNGVVGSRTYASVGLMVGAPMEMMGFPAKTQFHLYSSLRNTTQRVLDVKISVNYMGNAGPVTSILSSEQLPPLHSKQIDVGALLKRAKLSDFNGMLNLLFSFQGRGGDLVVATGSLDQTGNYVFEVQPQGIGKSLGKGVSYWSTASGYDTMIGLLNGSDIDQDFAITFYYSQHGSYKLPVHLAARGSTNIDMAELIGQGQPDSEGNVFSAPALQGSASIENAKGGPVPIAAAVSVGVFNVHAATCTSYCVDCTGYVSGAIVPSSFNLSLPSGQPSGQVQLTFQAVYRDLARNQQHFDNIDSGLMTWTPTNTAAANVDYNGLVTVNSTPGSAGVEAIAYLTPFGGAATNCDYQCPSERNFPGSSTGTVSPHISSISPTQGLVGTNVSVTIQGNGLTTASINAGSGISASISPNPTDTQLQATLAIGPTATAGNHSITVTAGGQTSPTSVSFFVQIPSHLTINAYPSVVSISNGNVVDYYGTLLRTNRCGVYRNIQYNLTDQSGNNILGGDFDLTENFANYSTTVSGLTAPPSQTRSPQNTSEQLLADTQAFVAVSPACPGSNDHEAFDQSFVVTVPSQSTNHFSLSTVVNVQRGNYSGTPKVDATITTP